MTYPHSFAGEIFASLAALSPPNLGTAIWSKYSKWAIPKIEENTLKLRGGMFYLKEFQPDQAANELETIKSLMPLIMKLKATFESYTDSDFHEFKSVTFEFIDTLLQLQFNLEEIANVHSNYLMSHKVLESDWNKTEDDHWDNC